MQTVDVRKFQSRMVNFNMPENLPDGNYTITIDGLGDFSFKDEAHLEYLKSSLSALIQLSKPVFKPGDMVQFRVIVLDSELKPPVGVEAIDVTIYDAEGKELQKWPSARIRTGVFESELQLSPPLMQGIWKISALLNGEELASRVFEVKEYVLSSFDVEVYPSTLPLEVHQCLNLTIEAKFNFGKPVNGMAKVELYLEDDEMDQYKEFKVFGKKQVELRFNEELIMYEKQQDVLVKTTFIEQDTNRTLVKESRITVFKHKYRVELIKEFPQFRPGLPFKCALQFRYHDGTPAPDIIGTVEVTEVGFKTNVTSDSMGMIELELHPMDNINGMNISFVDDDNYYFEEQISKMDMDAYIKVELKSP
uniref:TEP1-F n=1 Tax=Anopheles culicifacies TaxID=139723 RepID=A0A182M8F0_9DIPT